MNGLGMYGMRYGARPEDFGAPGTEMPAFMQGQILANQQYAQQQDQQQQMQARQFALQQAEDAADNQQQFNQLASQAYSTPVDQRNTLLGKMAALDPNGAMQQQKAFAALDAGKKAQVQAQLQNIAQKFTAIAQDPDPQRQQQEYNAMIAQAEAAGKDMSMFKNVPPAVGAKMAIAQISDMKGLMGMDGMASGGKLQTVTGADGKVYQIKQGPNGVQAVPIPIQGAGGNAAPSGLPAETQAYVPKVMEKLGNAPAFDQFGQPTAQLLDAVQAVESGGNPNAVSPAGAQGAYQFMPATAASVGLKDPFDPMQSRMAAAKYLGQLYKQFGGNAQEAIAAYNAGPGRVQQATSTQNGNETNQFLTAVQKGSAGAFSTMTPDQVKAAGLPAGTVAQVGKNGEIHVVSKPGAEGSPQTFGDPTKTGQDYLATLDPQIASQVQALDQGRMQFPSSFALKTPYWQGMLAAVSRYDPSFDAINYNARASARKSFTSGKEAQQVNALNTVAQHLAQLQGYANALDNASFTPYNSIKNALSAKMGNSAPTNFDRTVLPVAQELERVWRGTGGSEADIQQWIKNLSSSSSPAQFKDAFTGLSDLIHGKLAALKDQYVQAMGTTANPYRFLSPATQKLFEGMDARDAAQFAADATAPNGIPNAAPQGAPQSGPIATNPQTGQRVQWNGSAWVPAQ